MNQYNPEHSCKSANADAELLLIANSYMAESVDTSLPPILPVGTAIVTLVDLPMSGDGKTVHPRGSTGVIISSPADAFHSYRIRFAGGEEVSLKRSKIQVLSHYKRTGFATSRSDGESNRDLFQNVIYRCVVGSRAYGLERDESDVDRRGVYIAPASMQWSIYGAPEQLERSDTEECYWELGKYIVLALKANPNVLETLYTPLVESANDVALRLREERGIFLSRLIYQTFNGYAMSQFRKIEQDVRNHGSVKWKHAMHLIRLLIAGIEALQTCELPVRVENRRDELIAIRDGLMSWKDVDTLRLELHASFETAFESSHLPERPDYERANAILVAARADMARQEGFVP